MYSDGRPRRTQRQQPQQQLRRLSNQSDGVFFDGQRWVPQESSPVRRAPSGPVVFDIGGDESDDDAGGSACGGAAPPRPGAAAEREAEAEPPPKARASPAAVCGWLLGGRPKVALVAIASLLVAAALSCSQAGLLAAQLPPSPPRCDMPQSRPEATSVGVEAPERDAAASSGRGDRPELVRWRGLVPVCQGIRFHVGERVAKLRAAADKDSAEVARLPPGTLVERVGDCVNQDGLVRALLRTLVVVAGAAAGSLVQAEGWATLTAEFIQGPRFFDPVDTP